MVVHATWIPDLRLSEDTWNRRSSLELSKYAVKSNVSTIKTEEKTGNEFGTLPWCERTVPFSTGSEEAYYSWSPYVHSPSAPKLNGRKLPDRWRTWRLRGWLSDACQEFADGFHVGDGRVPHVLQCRKAVFRCGCIS